MKSNHELIEIAKKKASEYLLGNRPRYSGGYFSSKRVFESYVRQNRESLEILSKKGHIDGKILWPNTPMKNTNRQMPFSVVKIIGRKGRG